MHATTRIQFEDFAERLSAIFDTLDGAAEAVIVERAGRLYKLTPEAPQATLPGYDPARAQAALRASAGALTGVDRDELLADVRAQRAQDSAGRPDEP